MLACAVHDMREFARVGGDQSAPGIESAFQITIADPTTYLIDLTCATN
jgi:hypothetical protein